MPGDIPDIIGDNPTSQESLDAASLILRAKNIKEYRSILTIDGTLDFPNGKAIESGATVEFINKGVFNGKWIIQKVTLHISENKLVTEIEFRKCMLPVAGTTIVDVPQQPIFDNTDPDPDPTQENP